MNDLRYSELQKFLCHHPWLKLDDVMIVSNDKGDETVDPRYRELKNMAKSVGFRWHETDYDTRIIELKEELERAYNFKFDKLEAKIKNHVQSVIMGGCNLGGCVYESSYTRRYSMGETTLSNRCIYVPMCAEYEQLGNQWSSKDDEMCRGCLQ